MREVTFREAVAEAMSEEMRRDELFLLEKLLSTTAPTKPPKACWMSLAQTGSSTPPSLNSDSVPLLWVRP